MGRTCWFVNRHDALMVQNVRVILSISRDLGPGSFWGASLLRTPGLGQTWNSGISVFSWGLLRLRPGKHTADLVCCLQHREQQHTPCLRTAEAPQSPLDAAQAPRLDSQGPSLSSPVLLPATKVEAHCSPVLSHLLAFAQAGSSARLCPLPYMLSPRGPDRIHCSSLYLAPPQRAIYVFTCLYLQACELLEAQSMPHSCLCPAHGRPSIKS